MKRIGMVAVFVAVAVSMSGCFLTPTFQRLGLSDSQVLTITKQYVKDKGYSQYVTDDEIDIIVKAAEASIEFQQVMEGISAKEASQAKIEETVKKLMDSGAFTLPASTNAVVK